MADPSAPEPKYTPFWRSERIIPVLLALLAVSFAIHIATWVLIFGVRVIIREQATELAAQLQTVKSEVISTDINIKRTIPVYAKVPIRKELVVPITTTVVINDSVEVPFETRFGNFSVRVPIRFNAPINATVPVVINETVDVNTSVNIDFDVPVRVPIADTTAATYLERLRQALIELARRL